MILDSQWYNVEDTEPPIDMAVLCFNGLTFVGIWDGTRWYASHLEMDPNRPSPTHWRELTNFFQNPNLQVWRSSSASNLQHQKRNS